MKDLLGLMGKAKEMQARMQAMQEEIAQLEASGQAGGGMVAAHNDAKAKVEQVMQEKTRALTAGLPIPPGMKLPF
jgi:DNA-binding protein YbaB